MADDILRASVQNGPPVNDDNSTISIDNDREIVRKLTNTIQDLIDQLKRQSEKDEVARVEHHAAVKEEVAKHAIKETRDEKVKLPEEQHQDYLKIFKDLHVMGDKLVSEKAEAMTKQFIKLAEEQNHEAIQQSKTFFGSQNPITEHISSFFEDITGASGGLAEFVEGLGGAVGIIGSFTLALGGAITAFGFLKAVEAITEARNFDTALFRSSQGQGYESYHRFGDQDEIAEKIQHHLTYRKNPDEDANRYFMTAAAMRPPEGTSPYELQSMAYTTGLLEDYGVNSSNTQRAGTSLIHDIGLNYGQAEHAILELATTAKNTGADISVYMDKIIQLSKTFKNLGITVSDVNATYQQFSNMTLANGQKLTVDESLAATDLQLSMRSRLSAPEAAYIGMNYGQNLHVDASRGYHGGVNLGQLKGSPVGQMLMSAYVRGGKVEGIYDAIAHETNDIVNQELAASGADKLPSGAAHDAKYLFTANKLGLGDRYVAQDSATIALVQKIADGQHMTSQEFGKAMKEVASKPLDLILEDFEKEFKGLMGQSHADLVKQANMMQPWQEIWERIELAITGVFIPTVEIGMVWLSTIGKFILAYGEHQNIGEAFKEAKEQYNSLTDVFKDMNDTSLKALIEFTPIGKTLADMYGLSKHPDKHDFSHMVDLQGTQKLLPHSDAISTIPGSGILSPDAISAGFHALKEGWKSVFGSHGDYPITSRFGDHSGAHSDHYHKGLDIGAPYGTPIHTPGAGVVSFAGRNAGFGNLVKVKQPDGTELWYGHMSELNVHTGQRLTSGEMLGRVGSTGHSTGAHLHLELHDKMGRAINPEPFYKSHKPFQVNINHTSSLEVTQKNKKKVVSRKVSQHALSQGVPTSPMGSM